MKLLFFKVLDKTVGVLARLFQSFLIKYEDLPKDPVKLIIEDALRDSADYGAKNFLEALQFQTKDKKIFWHYCLSKCKSLQPISTESKNNKIFLGHGIIVEFGVFKGNSINFFAKKCPNAQVYGFDSFLGLEEDWSGWIMPAGSYSTNGTMPRCESNVKLFKGWFTETVPTFEIELDNEQISLLHIDSDTYKPAKYVLNALVKNLKAGSIIVFDEYYGYTGWKLHEFRAFQEFVVEHDVKYKYIAYTGEQVAVEIL